MVAALAARDAAAALRLWPALWLAASCTANPDPALLNPDTCVDCHPSHVQQWRGSMHAYAADDPVFRAMNAEAIQTPGVPPDFCVQCHAPVALRLGETTDGSNLDDVPAHLRGVTCVFCHQLDGVDGAHNAQVSWTFDGLMRGGITDPIKSDAHKGAYDPIFDRNDPLSSDACGACHDVVLPDGLHLERTYAEWKASTFQEGPSRQGCTHCHLPGSEGAVATVPGAPIREVHDHTMAGVDVALIEWPNQDAQRAAIADMLDRTLLAELCVVPVAGGSEVQLTLENVLAGHDFPSGASHDRRVWVEVIGSAGGSQVLTSGVRADDEPVENDAEANLVRLHDLALTADGSISHAIVDAVSLEERALTAPPPTGAPHARTYRWQAPGVALDEVSARVRLRPIGLDVLQPHVASGAIAPGVVDAAPTFTLASTDLRWTGPLGSCVTR